MQDPLGRCPKARSHTVRRDTPAHRLPRRWARWRPARSHAARFEPRDQVFGQPVFAVPKMGASRDIEPQAAGRGGRRSGGIALRPGGKRSQGLLNGFRLSIGANKLGIHGERIRQRLMQMKPCADGRLVESGDAADVAVLFKKSERLAPLCGRGPLQPRKRHREVRQPHEHGPLCCLRRLNH